MADIELIKPRELPEQANVQATDALMVDNGTVVGKATPEKIVNAGAPVASEAEALAGVNNTKRMTPLRVRQVLDNVNNPAVLRAQAWAESSTPPDPLLPDSKSAKTWASIAEQGTVMVQWSMIAEEGQTVLGNDITTGEPIRAFGGVAQISVNGFGPITPEEYSVDSDGVVTLTAPLAEGDVVSGFTQPRLSNSEAQAVVQGVLQQTGADVAAAQEAADRADAASVVAQSRTDIVLTTAFGAVGATLDTLTYAMPGIMAGATVRAGDTNWLYEVLSFDDPDHDLIGSNGLRVRVMPVGGVYNAGSWRIVDAASYQRMLDRVPAGSTILNPDSAVFELDGGLRINKRMKITGRGEMRYLSGLLTADALAVWADGVSTIGIYMTNPTRMQTASGARLCGIHVGADGFYADDCNVDGFQNPIVQRSSRFDDENIETAGFLVHKCRTPNCLGVGTEDRGDGITAWGRDATIAFCDVSAAPDQDCRVGIHSEWLPRSGATWPLYDSKHLVIGNRVSGPFRRSIANEGVSLFSAIGNICKDPTWWGVAGVQRGGNCLYSGNHVIFTSPGLPGSTIDRAPYMMYGAQFGAVWRDNTSWVTSTGSVRAFIVIETSIVLGEDLTPKNTLVSGGNHIADDGAIIDSAIFTPFGSGIPFVEGPISFENMSFEGPFRRGLYGARLYRTKARNLRFISTKAVQEAGDVGLYLVNDNSGEMVLEDIYVENFSQAAQLSNCEGGQFIGGKVKNCGAGIDLPGTTETPVERVKFEGIAGAKISNVNAANRLKVKNNQGQLLTWSGSTAPGTIAAGANFTTTITVPGASPSDFVSLVDRTQANLGLVTTAWVSAADTVTIQWSNPTASPISRGSSATYVEVMKFGNLS